MEKSGKRYDIIKAALELIAEQGFHGTSMYMIAEKAGVGAGTIYRYFESKDDLINQLRHELYDSIMVSILESYPEGRPIRERFIHIGATVIRYFISHPIHFRFVEQYHHSPYGVSFRRDKLLCKSDKNDIVKDLFEQGVEQQVLKDLPLIAQFAMFFGPLFSIVRDHILGFVLLNDALIIKIIEACWDGLKR